MRYADLAKSSWQSLLRTRNRSILTMLGIVIGISAVILSLSIGESAQKFILSQISSFGSDQLIIDNGPREDSSEGISAIFEETLVAKDLKKIQKETWVTAAAGEIFQYDLFQAQGYNQNTNVTGAHPEEIEISDYQLADGRFLLQEDLDSRSKVAVLGNSLAKKAFGESSAVGRSIKIGKNNFKVIGVMEPLGTQFFQNLDDMITVPATTMMQLYNKNHYTYFIVKTAIPLDEAKRRIEVIMRDLHDIDNPDGEYAKDDFHVVSQEEAIKAVNQITGVLQILLSAIAAISLLVGGIGIMNIMFVSVTERIKEIGLRKAIGAQYKDILRQFLSESAILTIFGGIGGIVFGSFIAWVAIQVILQFQEGWEFSLSLNGVILGVVVSSAIGIIFGYMPARKAAKLNPIDALRSNE